MRSIGKTVGTVVCVGGAVSMALLKGPKLLNSGDYMQEKMSLFWFRIENWLLGCLFLSGGCWCWSSCLVLLVQSYFSHSDRSSAFSPDPRLILIYHLSTNLYNLDVTNLRLHLYEDICVKTLSGSLVFYCLDVFFWNAAIGNCRTFLGKGVGSSTHLWSLVLACSKLSAYGLENSNNTQQLP